MTLHSLSVFLTVSGSIYVTYVIALIQSTQMYMFQNRKVTLCVTVFGYDLSKCIPKYVLIGAGGKDGREGILLILFKT